MTTSVSAEDITRNPAWHLYDIDLQRGELHFLEVTPETLRVSAFLDTRIAFTRGQMHGFSIEEASAKTGQSVSLVKVNIHRGITRMMIAAQRQMQVDG